MSSAQCQKPGHEHKLTDKVKELATSVTKVFTEHKHQHGHQSCHVSSTNHNATVKYHDGKKNEGHCLPHMGNHKKDHRQMMKNKKNKKNRECRGNDSSSDSSSSSESEDEAHQKRATTKVATEKSSFKKLEDC